jgi:hypothetical protein
MKKAITIILALLIVTALGLFASGYRLTAESAAKANSFIGDSQLVLKTDSYIGEVFVFKKSNYFITAAPQKRAFLWVSRVSFSTEYVDNKNDLVRLIGGFNISSETQNGAVMIVQSHDNRVAYIEAGAGVNKKREYGNQNGIFIFSWSQLNNQLYNSEPTAYSNSGDKLYIYSYPKQTPNYTDEKELRWYPVT